MEVAMVKDGHVKELRRLLGLGRTLCDSARMTEMSEKTARKYRADERLPSQQKSDRNYRTRTDPFEDVWAEVQQRLEAEPRLKAKTLFEWLQQTHEGQFPDSTRRTFERRVAKWRSLHGPGKTVIFGQDHHPGRLAASDFTVCNELGVKIAGHRFDHTFFHCVLTYSNVESVSLCFSESFEALSAGIQKAFWEFGGVPQRHRSDSLAAAVRNHSSRKTLTDRYAALMSHYDCEAERTNARCANENGDVESSNRHLKDRIEQALLLRGSRNFESREEYVQFVEQLVTRANGNRQKKYRDDLAHLNRLPAEQLDTDDLMLGMKVSRSSTIRIRTNTYSVPSRLIDNLVDVRIGAEQITVTHQGHLIQTMPRLIGKRLAAINYRHIIDSLVRKPGAFANYQYREEMFPTSSFRMAWDALRAAHSPKVADKMYVQILELAAHESQDAVADALRHLLATEHTLDVDRVRELVADATSIPAPTDVTVEAPDLCEFDSLLSTFDKECPNHDQDNNETSHTTICREGHDNSRTDETISKGSNSGNTGRAGSNVATDRPVEGAASADISRSIPGSSCPSSDGKPEPPGLSVRTGHSGMRDSSGGTHQTSNDTIETATWQDMGLVQLQAVAVAGDSSVGNAQGWLVPESLRERAAVRQAGFGQESRALCVVGAVDSAGPQHPVHDLQPAGPATADGKTRPASAEDDQTAFQLRGPDHRRPGLRPAESRGDGSAVHAAGGTLRTRKRLTDEQSGIQQVGPDLQGYDDDGRSDRPTCSSQRDHRAECPQLPSRNGKEDQVNSHKVNELPKLQREF
jgi:hypothetical protein